MNSRCPIAWQVCESEQAWVDPLDFLADSECWILLRQRGFIAIRKEFSISAFIGFHSKMHAKKRMTRREEFVLVPLAMPCSKLQSEKFVSRLPTSIAAKIGTNLVLSPYFCGHFL